MLLLSGRANTRCSVCRFDSWRTGARNGFGEPRDWVPKSALLGRSNRSFRRTASRPSAQSYQKYYNEGRTLLSLHKDAPIPRTI